MVCVRGRRTKGRIKGRTKRRWEGDRNKESSRFRLAQNTSVEAIVFLWFREQAVIYCGPSQKLHRTTLYIYFKSINGFPTRVLFADASAGGIATSSPCDVTELTNCHVTKEANFVSFGKYFLFLTLQ